MHNKAERIQPGTERLPPKTVFIDESKTKGYILVAAEVVATEAAALRRGVSTLRRRGQSRLHMVKESDRSRRMIIARLRELEVVSRVYHVRGLRQSPAREVCLTSVADDAVTHGHARIVLERDSSIEKSDRAILRRQLTSLGAHEHVSYAHDSASSEPLLWIPDVVAWCFARGGEWRSRIEPLIVEALDLYR